MQQFTDETAPVLTDFDLPSDTMLIVFGGFFGKLQIPVFEFFKVTSDIPVKKLFVRDLQQRFYQRGLPGIAEDTQGVADFLTRQIEEQDVKRVVMFGNSGGGYAALLFGCLVPNVTEVHSFVPRTFFNTPPRFWMRNPRFIWAHLMFLRVYAKHMDERPDLEPLIRQKTSTHFHVYYGEHNKADRGHAKWLEHLPNVTLYRFPYKVHRMVKFLRDNGELKEILLRALDSAHRNPTP
jgi:predicted lipase